jgi:hypothetical protein
MSTVTSPRSNGTVDTHAVSPYCFGVTRTDLLKKLHAFDGIPDSRLTLTIETRMDGSTALMLQTHQGAPFETGNPDGTNLGRGIGSRWVQLFPEVK